MTLHTRVMVTTPGIDPKAAFIRMRQLIDAGEGYSCFESPQPESEFDWERTANPGLHMNIGQGLPALMWVEWAKPGEHLGGEGHDDYCEDDCAGEYHDPGGYVEIHYDTAYGYRADNNASCSDLHAYLTREIGAWLTERGAEWRWYDESGDGWQPDLSDYGTLGDPDVGRPGSTVVRHAEDEKRAFGNLALGAIFADLTP